jgi:NRPS condensation-like uncharacterized protein
MLQWSHLHPYNAVHVIKVAVPVSPETFEDRINFVLASAGLGTVSIDEATGRYEFQPTAPRVRPRLLSAGSAPERALHQEIADQLNEPFLAAGPFIPFRFFILPAHDGAYLGIAYFHAVADADSIGRLLLSIATASSDPSHRDLPFAALRPNPGLKASLGRPWERLRCSLAAVRQYQRLRTSHRPPACAHADARNEFRAVGLSQPQTKNALTKAKGWGVTVNDLCLASLLLSVAPLTTSRLGSSRPNLSTACVVNLRDHLPRERRDQFGLCLGSFSITLGVRDGVSLRELAQSVRDLTREIKEKKLALGAALTFWSSRFMLRRLSLEKQRNFYRKSYPVWGSITNRRVDDLCEASGSPQVTDYLRAVSAGPAMPFVISVTGIAGRLNLGISSKPNVINAEAMTGVIERFTAFLTEPEER